MNGDFEIAIPSDFSEGDEVTLFVSYIGYKKMTGSVTVPASGSVTRDFVLDYSAVSMEEVVVTGLAAETPQTHVPFSVEQMNVADMQMVPTPSVTGLIQGKIPGVKAIQGSGMPGSEPSFQFRGPTSITGRQEPLVVIDGVITRGGIADINTQDIESIEVVKGAAAAALYGSRAQAGVLQIFTKTGAGIPAGPPRVTIRSTFESNSLEHLLGHNRGHPWRMNSAGQFIDFDGNVVDLPAQGRKIAYDDGGTGLNSKKAFADKEFPGKTYDPMRQFYDPGNRRSTNVSISGTSGGGTQYFISGAYTNEEGPITIQDAPMIQGSTRLNLKQAVNDKLTVSMTSYFSDRDRSLYGEGGESYFLRRLTFLTAQANLLAEDPNEPGGYSHIGEPIDVGNAAENPVNRLVNTDHTEDRSRFLGGFDATYSPFRWLKVIGNVSIDRIDIDESYYQRPGLSRLFKTVKTLGSMRQEDRLRQEFNASLTLAANRQFGDLTMRNRVRWLMETLDNSGSEVRVSELPVGGVHSLGVATGTPQINSYSESIRSEGLFLINQFTYKDKYVGDFLVRQDGSSLFGADERWQNYGRVSMAWRVAQEPWFNVDWIDELKPRFSIGTSGGRPRFDAQYQTYAISSGQLIPTTLGNKSLKPELATEQEIGIDMVIAQRLKIVASLVDMKVEDQLLLVPLPSSTGFESQWKNAGTIETDTWEVGIEALIVDRPGLQWTTRVNLDKSESIITELNTPSFEITTPGYSRARMMVQEGEKVGAFYGFQWLESCDGLKEGSSCDEFDVNDMGHLVYVGAGNSWKDGKAKDLWGTKGTVNGRTYDWGHPIRPDSDSPLIFTKLGDSQPDLNASLSQDIQWGNVGISFLLDGEWGASIYNFSHHWQSRDWHNKIADMRGVPDAEKKPISYFSALQYRNNANSFFAEDADYVKLREVSVRYIMYEDDLPDIVRRTGIKQATINLIGRNLKTWTDYLGFDPEVGTDTYGGSAVVGRVDEWAIPNYRSFGIDVEVVF